MPNRILFATHVMEALGGISRDTLRRLVLRGDFPKPVWITAGRNGLHGWRESEVDAWIESRPVFDLSEEDDAPDEASANPVKHGGDV
jgi:predicted DNA-binding transcriptional regulator AlpA